MHGKGTFFNYFLTKQHILRHFEQRQTAAIETWFRDLVAAITAWPASNPEIIRAVVGSFVADEHVRVFVNENQTAARMKVAAFLEVAQGRGEMRTDIPAAILARTFSKASLVQCCFGHLGGINR